VTLRLVTKGNGAEMFWGLDTPKIAHINPRQYGPYGNDQVYDHRVRLLAGESHMHILKVMDSFGDGWGTAYWELLRVNDDGVESRIIGGPEAGRVEGFGHTQSFYIA